MNRKSFLKLIGLGAVVTAIAPEIMAEPKPKFPMGGIVAHLRKKRIEQVASKHIYKHGIEFEKVTVKYRLGQMPEGMAAEWMTKEDWKQHDEYVERLKAEGKYLQEEESTILIKRHPLFDYAVADNGLILDLDAIEKHEFKLFTL